MKEATHDTTQNTIYDTLILGAGAAGLAAAHALNGSGQKVALLEAQARIGGRVLSLTDPLFPRPLDGGAEFIHGRAAAASSFLRAAGVIPVDTADGHFLFENGALSPAEGFFSGMSGLLEDVGEIEGDLSFAALLEHPANRSADEGAKTLARMMVEGFDAADPQDASSAALAEEWAGDANEADAQFRPLGGYGGLLRFLRRSLAPEITLHLNTAAREVDWAAGRVRVRCDYFGEKVTFSAARLVVTLPVSLLEPGAPGAVRFTPALDKDLTGLAMGPVVKVLLKFSHAFWEELDDGRYRSAAYFHHPEAPFPTFWTSLPVRTPVLTAWAGGPKAALLDGRSEDEMVRRVLSSLDSLFEGSSGRPPKPEAVRVFDWQRDPFSRGAYSYVRVGGTGARARLAAPLEGTLFFAGEATHTGGEAGTVFGALQSGVRAAGELSGRATEEA